MTQEGIDIGLKCFLLLYVGQFSASLARVLVCFDIVLYHLVPIIVATISSILFSVSKHEIFALASNVFGNLFLLRQHEAL